MKIFVICIFLIVNLGCSFCQTSNFLPEIKCSRTGGLCVHRDECEVKDTYTDDNYCSMQSLEGAVCCSRIPDSWTDCLKRGGECSLESECGTIRIDEKGHCEEGYVCCHH